MRGLGTRLHRTDCAAQVLGLLFVEVLLALDHLSCLADNWQVCDVRFVESHAEFFVEGSLRADRDLLLAQRRLSLLHGFFCSRPGLACTLCVLGRIATLLKHRLQVFHPVLSITTAGPLVVVGRLSLQ